MIDHADHDGPAIFWLAKQVSANSDDNAHERQRILDDLRGLSELDLTRDGLADDAWVQSLSDQLGQMLDTRVRRVAEWIGINVSRFQSSSEISKLQQAFDTAVIDLKDSIEICKVWRSSLGNTMLILA